MRPHTLIKFIWVHIIRHRAIWRTWWGQQFKILSLTKLFLQIWRQNVRGETVETIDRSTVQGGTLWRQITLGKQLKLLPNYIYISYQVKIKSIVPWCQNRIYIVKYVMYIKRLTLVFKVERWVTLVTCKKRHAFVTVDDISFSYLTVWINRFIYFFKYFFIWLSVIDAAEGLPNYK